MKDKKSIIEESLADFKLIETTLTSNSKEILRSVAKEEITEALNESLREEDYDIEDIEVGDETQPEIGGGDVDALPVADAPIDSPIDSPIGGDDLGGAELGGSEELGIDDMGVDAVDGGLGLGAEEGSEDYEMDMTGASDEDVITVYKKLSGEDEIEVVSDSEVIIKDPVSGSEYNVKLGGGSILDQGELDDSGEYGVESPLDAEIGGEPEIAPEIGGIDAEPEAEVAPEIGASAEPEADSVEADFDADSEETEKPEEEDEDVEESVVYEVELSEDADEIAEDIIRSKGHDKELVTTSAPNTGDIEGQTAPTHDGTKAVKPGSGGEGVPSTSAPGLASGDIEGQTAEKDKEIKGDNLVGGFKDDGQNGTGDNHAPHVMEGEEVVEETAEVVDETAEVVDETAEVVDETVEAVDENAEVIDEEDVVEGEEAIDEKIASGIGMSIGKHRNQSGPGSIGAPDGPGAKNEGTITKLAETAKKYNALLSEARKLKEENEMFRTSLKGFRKMLGETAVFNSNLTYVTKLFLEHSTTGEEKKQILERFDNEVVTIEESKKLYKNIVSELGSKKPMRESVENKIVSEQSTSQSAQLNETKVYVDPAQKRILDLMRRTHNR